MGKRKGNKPKRKKIIVLYPENQIHNNRTTTTTTKKTYNVGMKTNKIHKRIV